MKKFTREINKNNQKDKQGSNLIALNKTEPQTSFKCTKRTFLKLHSYIV